MAVDWPNEGEIWYHFPTDMITKILVVKWDVKSVRFTWGRKTQGVHIHEFIDRYVWRRVAYANSHPTDFQPPPPKRRKTNRIPTFVSAEQRRLADYKKGIR